MQASEDTNAKRTWAINRFRVGRSLSHGRDGSYCQANGLHLRMLATSDRLRQAKLNHWREDGVVAAAGRTGDSTDKTTTEDTITQRAPGVISIDTITAITRDAAVDLELQEDYYLDIPDALTPHYTMKWKRAMPACSCWNTKSYPHSSLRVSMWPFAGRLVGS